MKRTNILRLPVHQSTFLPAVIVVKNENIYQMTPLLSLDFKGNTKSCKTRASARYPPRKTELNQDA